ncbi:unnamed protein product [Orchesella dallaii]|uniref:Alkyl transferase n=1 Tax=Orchesella dallaii TaxID=48710 RepID=A0ABP1RM15_9HEXA
MKRELKIEESILQKLFRNILQQGQIPKHIAFVLDGNRRYAREKNMTTIAGHRKGSDTFDQIIDCAMLCGVQELTAYVFSIDNFKRTEDEVRGILALLLEKFKFKLENPDEREGICYRFVGNWSLFPKHMTQVMAKLMMVSRYNTKIVVNIAFAYTGRHGITSGVMALLKGLQVGDVDLDSITETLVEESLHVEPMPSVDMLIRTGESRLSDFLTWETSDQAVLCFREQYWPAFSYWKFLAAIFYSQANRFTILSHAGLIGDFGRVEKVEENTPKMDRFLQKKTTVDWNSIEAFASGSLLKEQFKKHVVQ